MKKLYIQPTIEINSLGLTTIIATSPKWEQNDAINGEVGLSGKPTGGSGDYAAKQRTNFYTGFSDDDLDY